MNKIGIMLSIVTMSALVIGCGGSGATSKKPTTGTVIDDYISGAKVCVDMNKNGVLDGTDKPCTTTNATGQFSFGTTVPSDFPLVMSGGTDVGTGEAFTGTLSAPAGSTVINPLTTIVQAVVASGKSVAEAQTIVKTSLGLPDVDLTTYDPIAAMASGTDKQKTDAKNVFAQQSSIQTILTTVSKTIAAAADSNENAVTKEVANQIARLMTSTTTPAAVDVAAKAQGLIEDTADAVIQNAADKANAKAVAQAVAEQIEIASDKVVESVKAAENLVDARTVAAEIATVVETNSNTIATALSADVVDTNIINAEIGEATSGFTAAVEAVVLSTIAVFSTVATPATIPVVTGTGGQGGTGM
jgi:hypothetical protein